MVQGDDISISITEEGAFINDAQVISADRIGSNGVVHVNNKLILPPSFTE